MLLVLDLDADRLDQSGASLVGVLDVERPRGGMVAVRMGPGTAILKHCRTNQMSVRDRSLATMTRMRQQESNTAMLGSEFKPDDGESPAAWGRAAQTRAAKS